MFKVFYSWLRKIRMVKIDVREMKKLQEYDPLCALFEEEQREWEEIKSVVSKVNLYCDFTEFDILLNNIIFTGKSSKFIQYFESVISANPSENYFLSAKKIVPCRIKA